MTTENEECSFLSFLWKIFWDQKFMKDHNTRIHKELLYMIESECEVKTQLTKYVKKVKQKIKNRKI